MTEHYTKKKAGHCIGYAMECLRNVCRKVLRGGYLPPAPNFMLLSRGLSSLFSTFFKKSNKITQIGPKDSLTNFKNPIKHSTKCRHSLNMLSFALGLFRSAMKSSDLLRSNPKIRSLCSFKFKPRNRSNV